MYRVVLEGTLKLPFQELANFVRILCTKEVPGCSSRFAIRRGRSEGHDIQRVCHVHMQLGRTLASG